MGGDSSRRSSRATSPARSSTSTADSWRRRASPRRKGRCRTTTTRF